MQHIAKCIILMSLIQSGFTADYMMTKPDNLRTCQIFDSDFVSCSTESVQQLFNLVLSGIDDLNNLPTLDPMKIKKIQILQGNGPVNINASLVKVTIRGFERVQVLESRVSPKDFSWNTKFILPKMRLDGIYDLNGRILIIPLRGHGKIWMEATNMNMTLKTQTKLYEKDGHIFYNVTGIKVNYELSGLKLNLENLFDGIKALEESTNQYLNENWRPASDALKPIVAQTIEEILLEILQKIFHFIPADYLISDIPKNKLI